ncbi:uncharacterized protein [Aegilops tauschii subsp. strangulata]|uniref:uncharacterized protein n=1 Tax=Aegilops tauschii subsp. strangulata TaxID=200361 RepID=UPI001ABC2558|nr:formin-like protein 18 [Aegilops tauschii subsp. strangulata]
MEEPSGSGGAQPGEDGHGQEPAHEPSSYASSNGARSAAVPPPPRATPLHLEQAGGGADGSGSAAVGVDRRGNGTPPPKVIPSPPSSATARPQAGVQAAVDKENRRWAQQLNSLRAEGAMHRKEQEKLSQVKAVVKVRPKQDKLFSKKGAKLDKLLLVKGKSVPSRLKSKIFRTKGRGICPEHVKHQTLRISEVRRHYKLTSDEANHLDAYSECRPVIGDGECFYRSFIFSYLEQVIDRQDTHEEHRLLRRVSTERANLQWNSEFSRSRRAFKELIVNVMKWKSTESTSSRRKEKLLKFFSTYDTTQDIFVFLRLLVAIQICSQRELYEPIIQGPGGNYSLEVWCLQHVIPARVYADHVMMVALARALEVPLRVESLQRGYAPDIYTGPGVPRPSVTLLYTGDHYDIIYPRAPSAESSSHQASQREHPGDQSSSHQASQRKHPGDQSSSQRTF